mmetsp:Transcript_51456/g.134385  ORF Transcript_51456/g.134385 Transcript_51456/m.134385 type:complete len:96 (-) Transcript_51456:290-577(-)
MEIVWMLDSTKFCPVFGCCARVTRSTIYVNFTSSNMLLIFSYSILLMFEVSSLLALYSVSPSAMDPQFWEESYSEQQHSDLVAGCSPTRKVRAHQ